MNSLPSTISPFFPFESGPNSFIEEGEWLSDIALEKPVGKLPVGLICNLTLSTPTSVAADRLELTSFTLDYLAGPTLALGFTIKLGSTSLLSDTITGIELGDLDSSLLTYTKEFSYGDGLYRIKMEFNGSYLKKIFTIAPTLPYRYAASTGMPIRFLPMCTRARPANPLQIRVVNPSAPGLRYGYDSFASVVTMSTAIPVNVESGYNVAAAVTQDSTGVTIEAGAGKGEGAYPICPDRYVPNSPAGLIPTNNDIQIVADACHPTYIMQHPDGPATRKLMLVFGNCDACCGCDDYENMFKAVKKIGLSWESIWDGFLQVNNKYLYTKSKFDITKANLRKLGVASGGYCNISRYKPWIPEDKSGVFRLYGAVTIYDRQYVEESVDGTSKAAAPIRSITISEITVKLTGEAGASFTPLELSGGVGNTEYPTMLEIAQPGSKPVSIPLNPTVRDVTDPQRLIVSGGGFYKIKLRPGATLALDIIGCVNQYQLYGIEVTFKWDVGIEMAELPGISFSTDLTLTDPKQALVPLNVVYVDPGI